MANKFTVQLSGEMDLILSELAEKQGVPKTQVIRQSLALMKYLNDEKKQDPTRRLAITDDQHNVVKEIVQP